MNGVVYVIFVTVFFVEYIVGILGLPGILKFLPEALSITLLFFLILRAAATKTFLVPPKYFFLFAFFLLHIVFGVILNDVDGSTIIAGIRYFLRFFPIFLLPAVFVFSENQIRGHLLALLALGVVQLPLAVYQRFVQFTSLSGDEITGSLGSSAIVTIYAVCSLLVLMAFYMKRRLSAGRAIVLACILFIPCILNETKVTMVIMVVGVFSMIFLATDAKLGIKKMVGVLSAFSVFLVVFIIGYNQLYAKTKPGGLLAYFINDKGATYLYQESEIDPLILEKPTENKFIPGKIVLERMDLRRVDSLIAPFRLLRNKPMKLYFGLGIGNVSAFNYSDFEGEFAHLSGMLHVESQTLLLIIWELGVGGAFIYLVFLFLILLDARGLSKYESFTGSLALGWLGITAVMVVSLIYTNILQYNSMGFLYFYLSGYLAVSRYTKRTGASQIGNRESPSRNGYA